MTQLLDEKTDRKRSPGLLGGVSVMALASGITMVLGMVIAMIATRVFTAAAYGNFILLVLGSSFLSLISNLGLGASSSRMLANSDDPAQKEELVNNVLTLRFILYVVAILVALAFGPLLFKPLGLAWNLTTFYYVSILFFTDSFTTVLQSILQGFFRFKQIAIWNLSSSLLNLIFLLVFIGLSVDGLKSLVFANWFAYTIAAIYMFFSIPVRKRPILRLDLIKKLVRFGFPLQLNGLMDFFYSRIDTLIIAAMFSTADIAYYEVARKIPQSLQALFGSFQMAFYPLLSRLYSKSEHLEAENLLKNSLRLVAFGGLCVACFAFLFGESVIRLLFSDQYLASAPVFVILSVNLSISMVGGILGNSLVSVGESDKPVKINVLHSLTSLVSNLLLIPPFGIIGAAISGMFGPIVTNPLNYIFLNRRLSVRAMSYLKPFIIFVFWIVFSILFPLEHVLLKVTSFASFVLVNYYFSVISMDDVKFMFAEIARLLGKIFPGVFRAAER